MSSGKSWDGIKVYYGSSFAMLISIPIPHISWISNSGKKNPLQHISTGLRWKLRDETSLMMLPLSESLSKD